MDKIILYQDMDGCLCDFKTAFGQKEFDKVLFKQKVFEDKIFENLEWMPNGKQLWNFVCSLQEHSNCLIDLQILTSLGCGYDTELGEEVKRQKTIWLEKNNIRVPANFVLYGTQKAEFAKDNTVLVDDTENVIKAFFGNGGVVCHYEDESYFECTLDLVLKIDEMYRGE